MRKLRNNKGEIIVTFFVCMIIFIIIALIISGYRSCSVGAGKERMVRATVTEKGIKRTNEEDIYLVYTKVDNDIAVFQITDSLIAGRFNSSDVYASIEVGKTYDFTVRGTRNEFMSWYPNIYEYKLVEDNHK